MDTSPCLGSGFQCLETHRFQRPMTLTSVLVALQCPPAHPNVLPLLRDALEGDLKILAALRHALFSLPVVSCLFCFVTVLGFWNGQYA